jgi:acyl CoA:acetate/3-ketoacid CoA transferase alpha subunit
MRHSATGGEFARQYLTGDIEVELIPQDALTERLHAGGCGTPHSTFALESEFR